MSVSLGPPPKLPGFIERHFPFSRRSASIEGQTMHFVDHGQGQPVLLVHGNPTWSFLWRKVIERLPSFRCIAPDLIGFGFSSKPRRVSAHILEAHIQWVYRLIVALELQEKLIVVGQDWGGPIAAGVAARMPGQLLGAVFGNTAVLTPHRPFRSKPFHRFSHMPVVSDLAFRGLNFPVLAMPTVQGDKRSLSPSTMLAYTWPFLSPLDRAGPIGLARMVPNAEDHPSTQPMDRIGAFWEAFEGPVGLVWGEQDPILGRALRRHERAFPQARVTRTQAGHFLQEEVPDAIADAIRGVAAQ